MEFVSAPAAFLLPNFFAIVFPESLFPLLLSIGVCILFGLLGDRMFFNKAYKKVLSDIEKKATSTS